MKRYTFVLFLMLYITCMFGQNYSCLIREQTYNYNQKKVIIPILRIENNSKESIYVLFDNVYSYEDGKRQRLQKRLRKRYGDFHLGMLAYEEMSVHTGEFSLFDDFIKEISPEKSFEIVLINAPRDNARIKMESEKIILINTFGEMEAALSGICKGITNFEWSYQDNYIVLDWKKLIK